MRLVATTVVVLKAWPALTKARDNPSLRCQSARAAVGHHGMRQYEGNPPPPPFVSFVDPCNHHATTPSHPDKQKNPSRHAPLQEESAIPLVAPNVPAGHLKVGIAVPAGQ